VPGVPFKTHTQALLWSVSMLMESTFKYGNNFFFVCLTKLVEAFEGKQALYIYIYI